MREVCETCEGTGQMPDHQRRPGDGPTCHACEGTGIWVPDGGCFAMPFVWRVQPWPTESTP